MARKTMKIGSPISNGRFGYQILTSEDYMKIILIFSSIGPGATGEGGR